MPVSIPTPAVTLAVTALGFALLHVHATRRRNATWVDFGWAFAIGALAVAHAITGDGAPVQRALAGLLGGTWGFRLAGHLLVDRILGRPEDGRYVQLRAWFGRQATWHFAWFFQAQALLAVLLAWPFALLADHGAPALAPIQIAGGVLFALALVGEWYSDHTLARWRADPSRRGRTCRSGPWRFSRHPNYFCEWLIWVAFALAATPAPGGGYAWLAPLAMYLLIVHVTGIPHTEAQALRSRGDEYRDYQRCTNAFFPGPPRATLR
jgi:steroid 5-alpha reductase family enzyme